jgi:Zn-finger nucleic acid-binding protein
MVILDLDAVEIDHCLACLGTWLDAGELELIVERTGGSVGEVARVAAAGGRTRGRRRCPRCRRRMRKSRVAADRVEVDACPAGHGWWFDQGEMRALVACAHTSETAERVARFFEDLYASELNESSKGG